MVNWSWSDLQEGPAMHFDERGYTKYFEVSQSFQRNGGIFDNMQACMHMSNMTFEIYYVPSDVIFPLYHCRDLL